MKRGEVWWADLPEPLGSEPCFLRPVVVIQSDEFNRSQIATVMCVPLTGSLRWATVPGNVLLTTGTTGLPKDSVANGSQVFTFDKALLIERVSKLPRAKVELIFAGIDRVLGRS